MPRRPRCVASGPRRPGGLRRGLGLLLAAALLVAAPPALAGEAEGAEASGGPGVLHRLLLYVPNRVLDVVDLVRLRARVGPGVGVGARVTEIADLYLGSYAGLWVGLPGPRGKGRSLPKLPLGVTHRTGIELGPLDVAPGVGVGPGFTFTEVGVDVHPVIVGLQAGFDPWEVVDLAAGLVLLDPRDDDL